MSKAAHLDAPFKTLGYDDSYAFRNGEGPATIFRTGASSARVRYIWFHGSMQATQNELVTRMANAFHEVGLNLEIVSVPWDNPRTRHESMQAVIDLVRSSPGKVIIGGHSAGGLAVEALAHAVPDKVAAVATVNAFDPSVPSHIPVLYFQGEHDGGDRHLEKGFKWQDRQVVTLGEGLRRKVVLRQGDHSARARLPWDHDKAKASASPETKRMNRAVAETLKGFLTEIGVHAPTTAAQ